MNVCVDVFLKRFFITKPVVGTRGLPFIRRDTRIACLSKFKVIYLFIDYYLLIKNIYFTERLVFLKFGLNRSR